VCECGVLINYDSRAVLNHMETKKHFNLINKNTKFITSISQKLPYDVKYEIISKLFDYYTVGDVSYSAIFDHYTEHCIYGHYDVPKVNEKYNSEYRYRDKYGHRYFKKRSIYKPIMSDQGLSILSCYRLISRDFNRVFENMPIYKLVLPPNVKKRIEDIYSFNRSEWDEENGSMYSLDYWSYESDESSDIPDLPNELFY
jgi:hypothetical protein